MNSSLYFILTCVILLLAAAVNTLILLLKKRKHASKAASKAEEKRFIDAIRRGLENDEFKMYLQFCVDNKTKKIVSAEALSRWETSDGELLFPGKYIGAMQKSGLITQLDYCMFENACRKLAAWRGTAFGEFTISCNFTRITISAHDFVEKIEEIANRYEFDHSLLLMEITEDTIERNLAAACENILKVKALGFHIALDDVGGGCTSLMNLCEYPIDVLKIDRAILLLASNERGKKLFSGIVALAHYLGLKVVCEGVETEEQSAFVSAGDCNYVQGWYYAKAISEAEAEVFAAEYMKQF